MSAVTSSQLSYQRPWRKQPLVKIIRRIAFYLLLLVLFFPFFFVFAWMVEGAFKTQVQNTAIPPLFVFEPTFNNFETVFSKNPMWEFLRNSAFVGIGSTVLALIFGLPAAYTIAKYKQQRLAIAILVARIMPGISFLVPWFIMFSNAKLIGTYTALILAHLLITLPMTIWLMIAFFEDIPQDLDDAALIDGCNQFQAFWLISLPLTKPGIAASAILSFIFSWNNFLFSLVLANQQTRPLPVAVFSFISYTQIDWGGLNAAAVIVTLPVLIMILFVQKHMVRGLTLGSTKG
ncbi:MAG: carbohydrate ABC transporter permease [Anaerolineales bacterium]|nr:carbohydrate ABC transporter permease [Anaerolineales bacterium]